MNHNFTHKIVSILCLILVFSVTVPSGTSQSAVLFEPAAIPDIVINEVMFNPDEGDYEWVELKNISNTPIKIDGYALTDEDSTWFEIPTHTPDVPPGAFVVVIFDGLGSIINDYDFGDNLVVLHTQRETSNAFDDVDQVALYDDYVRSTNKPNTVPPQIVAFVAWGGNPGSDAVNAVEAGIWLEGTYVDADIIEPGYSIGLIPGSLTIFFYDYSVYITNLVTQGSENLYPYSDRIYIPAGEFQMGCDPDHNNGFACYDDEEPLHTVYLDAYLIDTTEVTNGQYAQCVEVGDCTPPYSASSWTRSFYYGNPEYADYPVGRMYWDQAQNYCTWVGGSLPTEAQWEKAARGSSDSRAYPWGDTYPNCMLANFYDFFGTGEYCNVDTSAVGSYPSGASPYGLLDMAGNGWEWVNDWWDPTYYSVSPYSNPTGPETGMQKGFRGGSWDQYYDSARVAYRGNAYTGTTGHAIGFRCAYPTDR